MGLSLVSSDSPWARTQEDRMTKSPDHRARGEGSGQSLRTPGRPGSPGSLPRAVSGTGKPSVWEASSPGFTCSHSLGHVLLPGYSAREPSSHSHCVSGFREPVSVTALAGYEVLRNSLHSASPKPPRVCGMDPTTLSPDRGGGEGG